MAAIQLPADDLVPAIAHRAAGTRQAEHKHPADNAGQGARLQGGQADGLIADHVEHHRKALDGLVEQGLHRLGRHVAAGQAGAAGGDDGVNLARSDPGLDLAADLLDVVAHDGAAG